MNITCKTQVCKVVKYIYDTYSVEWWRTRTSCLFEDKGHVYILWICRSFFYKRNCNVTCTDRNYN